MKNREKNDNEQQKKRIGIEQILTTQTLLGSDSNFNSSWQSINHRRMEG